ncbi:MAG: hypothetical protein M3Y45_09105 [Actinomycetota bacterium]|nr:hypothetical protein [Actinomycetota bacterium]
MKRTEIARLRAANPGITPAPVPPDLFERITGQTPGGDSAPEPRGACRLHSGAARFAVAVLAGLLVSVGVAWSATGENPVAIVITKVGNRLVPPEPGTNLFVDGEAPLPESLSIVERPDEESVGELPGYTLSMLQMLQTGFRQSDLDRIRTEDDFRRIPRVVNPEFIRGVGRTELPSGEVVSVVATLDRVCAFWLRLEEAMCGSDEEIVEKGIYQFRVGHFRKGPWEIFGLVDDRVARVSAESSSVVRDATVQNNVFQLAPLPPFDVTLTAFDREGSVLYRTTFR